MEIKINEVCNYLVKLYKASNLSKMTAMLIGMPGIGKSETCNDAGNIIAKNLGKEFIVYSDQIAEKVLAEPDKYFVFVDLRLTECEPSDLSGIPERVDGAVRFVPLLWAVTLSKCAGMLVLDELTNIQRSDVISASYKLILDRSSGFTKFNENVMIIACGNDPKHSSVANLLPVPLVSRMIMMEIIPPKIDSWFNYMEKKYSGQWDTLCYAFLKRFDESMLIKLPKTTETLKAYPVPRTWTATALYLKAGMPYDHTVSGLVGDEVAGKFEAFRKTKVDIEELMEKPELFKELSIDGKYMSCVMFGAWLSKEMNLKKINSALPLVDAMAKDSKEYVILTATTIDNSKLIRFIEVLYKIPQYKSMLEDIVEKKKDILS